MTRPPPQAPEPHVIDEIERHRRREMEPEPLYLPLPLPPPPDDREPPKKQGGTVITWEL